MKEKTRGFSSIKEKPYPNWSCVPCGKKHGGKAKSISCFHFGKCDVCGKNAEVTEPRDFGHFKNWFTK
jgi:hypothetical protein